MSQQRKSGGLISELNRRNVFRVAIAYVLVGWVLLQIADVLFPALTLPDWTIRFVAALLILGFPLVVFFAWAFELTPEGLKREQDVSREESITHETAKKLNVALVAILVLALSIFALDTYVWVDEPAAGDAPEVASTIDNKSIAVLPFVNMSDDPDNEYFSEGMSEELLNLLAKIPDLKVIGRTSSFQFKDQTEDLRVIGEKLGVANILEGSVRKSGNTVRITAQLIDAEDGTHLWSDSFDRDLDDIFKVQDEIARSVVETLKVKLLGDQVAQRVTPTSSEAYDLYLKAQYFRRQLGDDRLEKARDYYQRALQVDPQLAVAWTGLAGTYINEILGGTRSPEEGLPLVFEALEKAREIDPNLADAHYTIGFVRMVFEWDFRGAEQAFHRALEIEPNSAQVLSGLGLLSSILGRPGEAIAYQRSSLEVDPLRAASRHNLGVIGYFAHDFEFSEKVFRDVLELTFEHARGNYYVSVSLLMQGKPDEAYAEIQNEPSEQYRLAGIALTAHALDLEEEADDALRALEEKHGDKAAFLIAEAHAYRGDANTAFEWLDRAVQQHEALVPWMPSSPFLLELHSDSRFDELLQRIGLDG